MSQNEAWVIYEAPKICPHCKEDLIEIALALTGMKLCTKCGYVTPTICVVDEEMKKSFEKKGIKAIRKICLNPNPQYIG